MSYKKFDLDKDMSVNGYFVHEGIRLFLPFFSGTAENTNANFPQHFVSGGVSGSYYVECFNDNKENPSSTRLMSLTYGHTTSSVYYSGSFDATYQEPKIKMYRLMAKRLLGDENRKFTLNGRDMNQAVFILVARNQYKDFIVPNSNNIWCYISGHPGSSPPLTSSFVAVTRDIDARRSSDYAGTYTVLQDSNNELRGLVFAQAGVAVIDPHFLGTSSFWSGTHHYEDLAKGVSGTTYNDLLWAMKYRFWMWDFSGSSRVESTFYKCTAMPDEFNYSSNPSFRLPTGEVITAISSSTPTTYITQVGLLGPNNEVIAVAKLQKAIKKNPHLGVTITVRIDH